MMEHMTENNTEQTPVVEIGSQVGSRLREARERMGLSIADVAGQIKFAPRQIEALEAGDLERLPEMAFVRGFIRSYAKIVKLDAQELLAALTPMQSTPGDLTPVSVNVPYPDANLAHRHNMIWLALAFVTVLIIVFVVRSNTDDIEEDVDTRVEMPVTLPEDVQLVSEADANPAQSHPEVPAPADDKAKAAAETKAKTPIKETKPVLTTAPAKPAMPTQPKPETSTPEQEATPTQPGAGATQPEADAMQPEAAPRLGAVRIEFIEESWLEIKDADENILTSQNYPAGSEARIEGNLPLSVLVGHAPSVRLYYKDSPVDLTPYTRPSTDVAFVRFK
ncbi:MAG TPA: RodZ domain-containing protein [Gallionella sp.]